MLALPRRYGPPPVRRRTAPRAAWLSVAVLAGLLFATSPAIAAQATTTVSTSEPVGGAQLGTTGTVYDLNGGLPAPPVVVAGGWVVADLDTGEVLGASNPHGQFGPASTLKVLSALVMLPIISAQEQILATPEAVNVDGSKVGIVPNHAYTADMLFTAMLVVSGNDASRVLASAAGGDDAVLGLMNAKAADLQAGDTVAKTVTGLDAPGQSTSAYDLALIARAALELPSFRHYVAIDRAQFSGLDVAGFEIDNHNLLLGHFPGTFGVKNGYTDASRATYVGAAEQNGRRLIVTLMRTDPEYRNAAEALLNWGFAVAGRGAAVGTLVAAKSETPTPTPAAKQEIAAAGARTPAVAPATDQGLGAAAYGGIGAGAALVVLFFGRRRQVKRRRMYRRTRLRLPDL